MYRRQLQQSTSSLRDKTLKRSKDENIDWIALFHLLSPFSAKPYIGRRKYWLLKSLGLAGGWSGSNWALPSFWKAKNVLSEVDDFEGEKLPSPFLCWAPPSELVFNEDAVTDSSRTLFIRTGSLNISLADGWRTNNIAQFDDHKKT